MKNRVIQSLLLLGMMVSLSAPLNIKADVVGFEKVEMKEIANKITETRKDIEKEMKDETLTASVSKKEDTVVNQIEENPYEYFNREVIIAAEKANEEMRQLDFIEDKKERFIAYKSIIDKYSYILDPPETIYDYYSEQELNLLFRVVQAEVGDEYTFEQKCNACSVILNRVYSDKDVFARQNTLSDVLIVDQFATISDGRYKQVVVSETTKLACEYVFMFGSTTEALFFDSDGSLPYKWVDNDGAHNLYTLWEVI